MQPNEARQVDPAKTYQIFLILWGAIFVSILLFFLLAAFIAPDLSKLPSNRPLTVALTVFGTLAAMVSFFIRQKMVARAIEQQRREGVLSAYIIAFALCEVAALFGMLVRFTTNDHYYYLLFVVAVVFLVLNMPRRSDAINALSGKRN